MAKYFFPSSFLLFLGNWIGQITLNWYVFSLYHNAIYLGLINFFRLIPILILSLWAGNLADKYNKATLIKITISLSFILTSLLCILNITLDKLPIIIFLIYSLGRGILSAVETPIRQSALPNLSSKLSTTQAVSYHSFIINICRSIGPAIAGFLVATYNSQVSFVIQAICYLLAALVCLPISFKADNQIKTSKTLSLKVVSDYFKENLVGARIFITSLLIMATGFSFSTLLPVLTDKNFPNQAAIFGTAMTCSAIGGIISTVVLPNILNRLSIVQVYYGSSILFGISLLGTMISNTYTLFISIFLIGLFSQWARTTNRIYFQERVSTENRGKIISVIMMDRGMIPLGSMLMSFIANYFGIIQTFMIMGLSTLSIALIFSIINNRKKLEDLIYD
ncbi:MFS transporter [Staphylococcus sp. 18_1_E_LY]|uniref:MFS transporter n=1 Tax=Staphylococcus lloydii TaxID=2781774 RepID=A0A7T1FAK7_9STAP|nr:MFS transporter [Staphylococcus lloydii]MBF7020511.1 MFS transporter [Staphylococcus lloydii]MBF7028194.1 MFS transporter [Staphylococcus lloydii]MDU9418148.1 MFS transporter [Staphylococcus lloydii]QPM75856.1 MFS transporter [Staphylococcus lloydii]